MEICSQALSEKTAGNLTAAKKLFAKALTFESQAASILKHEYDEEPTRSILYRSAASIALDSGKNTFALKLVKDGLQGKPSAEIKRELIEVAEQGEKNIQAKRDEKLLRVRYRKRKFGYGRDIRRSRTNRESLRSAIKKLRKAVENSKTPADVAVAAASFRERRRSKNQSSGLGSVKNSRTSSNATRRGE